MEFGVWTKGLATLAVDCLVLGVFEEGELSGEARSVDTACGGRLKQLLGARRLRRTARRDAARRRSARASSASRVLLTGLGTKKHFQRKAWRRACQAALARLARTRIDSCAIALDRPEAKQLDDYYLGRQVAELTGAALYRINDLKTAKKPRAAGAEEGARRPGTQGERRAARPHGRRGGRRRAVDPARPGQPAAPTCARRFTWPSRRARSPSATRACASRCSMRRRSGARTWAACSRSSQGSQQPPRFIVLEYQGAPKGRRAGGAGRQGRDLRHRRHLAQGPAGHGRDEVRHERRRRGHRQRSRSRRSCGCA